ncbi:hypothetical protein KR51_00029430 [Rubidibacter lacunae KORDI 51-2]|uniref:DUF2834 domain-containing protein n=1 Tax=Rubidibacter lacunae KORDI 51-2 TaxID=582515 RepID=U5DL06_9CHRO|nr:hypothetical protein KR51_00029430 [Rubidibacter lacunae KORDI 51-2]
MTNSMQAHSKSAIGRGLGLIVLWLIFATYAFRFAPPVDFKATFVLIRDLVVFKIEGINPLVAALFYLMGMWPLAYACLTLADGRGQRLWAWFFTVASMAVGAFALLPYLALRSPNATFPGKKGILIRLLDARLTGIAFATGGFLLLGFGLLKGNWVDFAEQFQSSRFIHVMSLDFCVLCLAFPALLGDDMARRGLRSSRVFWAVSLLPIVGPLMYLCLRPALPEPERHPQAASVRSSPAEPTA